MIKIDCLRNYSLFAGINIDTLKFIKPLLDYRVYFEGDKIVKQGDAGDKVFFILEGRVGVFVDEQEVGELGEGQQFGEMHLIDIMARCATVKAISEVTTISMSKASLLKIRDHDMDSYILLILNCARDISRRLRTVDKEYAQLICKHNDLIRLIGNDPL